ncbi:MAG: signal peptidase I [Phycisphaerae bacterium]|nr:signal peptidase I [Phycisphaerae bacterium]
MSEIPSSTPGFEDDPHTEVDEFELPRALRVIDTMQTVLIALILAFVFRAFLVEQFIIPTGSMADALLGMHSTQVCPRCGWEYDYGPSLSAPDSTQFHMPARITCPNCGLELTLDPNKPPPTRSGDRIVVQKWPYAIGGFLGPKRWDVVVFRDPVHPWQNYVKRLIGLPGERVEILDGDVYIDDVIARKTPAAQSVLWFVVHDQGYVPAPEFQVPAAPAWITLGDLDGAQPGWTGLGSRVIHYDALDERPRTIALGHGYHIRDISAYNHGEYTTNVGDVRLASELWWRGGEGWLAWELTRADVRFRITLHADGAAQLMMTRDDQPPEWRVLDERHGPAFRAGQPMCLEFTHVDYRVYLAVDGDVILTTRDEDYAPNMERLRNQVVAAPTDLRLTASSVAFDLASLRVDRDVYYTERVGDSRRAHAGHPFELGPDEYFMLGDNSAHSHDGREWRAGDSFVECHYRRLHESDPRQPLYRPGTVRGDLIVGRASFVYLPGLLPIESTGRLRVPDVGRTRFVR